MRTFISLSLACTAILLSCTKEKLNTQQEATEAGKSVNNAISNHPVGRLQLITREVSFNSINPTLKQVRVFSYDSQNRCTRVDIGTIDSSGNAQPVFNISRTITFIYNGDEPLPEKVESVRTVFPNLVTQFFYKYDSNGNKITDSVRVLNQSGQPADRIVRYSYINKHTIYSLPEFINFPIFNNPFDTLTIDKSNIKKITRRTPIAAGERYNIYEFEYDNKINPYNALNIYNSLYMTNPALGIAYNISVHNQYGGVSQNNIISYKQDHAVNFIFNYVYDPYKYPIKSEFNLEGSNFITTTYYFYKGKHDN